jgi:phosphoglycerate dehydrogenase-like enzyme
MKRYKALFLCDSPENIGYVYSDAQRKQIAELTQLHDGIVTSDMLIDDAFADTEVLFSTWGMPTLTDAQLAHLPNLRAVFYAAGATEGFSAPLFKRNICLCSAWRANAIPVAQFTVAQIILSLKNYFSNTTQYKCQASWATAQRGPGIFDETVALIGDGAIATLVAKMLDAYQLKVLVIPSRHEQRTISLEDAFSQAYVVSNHLPNLDNNKRVLTKAMFASMRQGATFINTGRGAQVDEEGLLEVLKARPDLTALLDVTTEEPLNDASAFYTLPNVHLSTHIAGSLNNEVHRMATYAIDDYIRFANGEKCENQVFPM